MESTENHIDVYRKIFAVMSELGWIEKDGQVSMGGRGGYAYATEAGFIAAIRPLMIKHGLVMLPHVTNHEVKPITTDVKSDNKVEQKVTYASSVEVVYRLIDIDSGSYVDVQMVGTGNDTGDKAIYKALTGAYKYALRQIFMVGTGDDPEGTDEDGNNTAVAPITVAAKKFQEVTGIKPDKTLAQLMRDNGYAWSDGFGLAEQKTARKLREMANAIKGGAKLEDAVK